MSTADDLTAAIADLDPIVRRGLAQGAQHQRDQAVVDGDHRVARFWNELACTVLDVHDYQRRAFDDLRQVFDSPPSPGANGGPGV